MHVSTRGEPTLEVAIVSRNDQTLEALRSYLRAADVRVRAIDDIGLCGRAVSNGASAFVIFPDDYRWESVVAAIADLDETHPDALPLLVTAQPKRFSALVNPERVLVIARPAWGWTILDAIRAHVETMKGASLER